MLIPYDRIFGRIYGPQKCVLTEWCNYAVTISKYRLRFDFLFVERAVMRGHGDTTSKFLNKWNLCFGDQEWAGRGCRADLQDGKWADLPPAQDWPAGSPAHRGRREAAGAALKHP